MAPDLVYIYKRSTIDELELRFSLRAAQKNLRFNRVYIIGDRPRFLQNATHIPFSGLSGKYNNAFSRIMAAARHPDISERFILMNDDFYALQSFKNVPYLHRGSLWYWMQTYPFHGQYYRKIEKTYELTGWLAKSFELHFPFVFEKQKLIELAEKYSLPAGVMLRTLYAHEYGIEGDYSEDYKAKTVEELSEALTKPFFSTSDSVGRSPEFLRELSRRFPHRSHFEHPQGSPQAPVVAILIGARM